MKMVRTVNWRCLGMKERANSGTTTRTGRRSLRRVHQADVVVLSNGLPVIVFGDPILIIHAMEDVGH